MKRLLLIFLIFPLVSFGQVQIGQDIDGEALQDTSGDSVSLSSDGTTVAIGAPSNDGNGVNAGHVRVFNLSDVLSTEEVLQSQFSIYPNPTSTSVTIQIDQNNILEKVTIYNNLGQLIKTSIETTIDTSNLSKGMYILELTTNQGKASKKLIIE
ncbi:T9SS type A sorting domain-containing protein [uncultured Dokdonia sp.]|uniref:T9SS type A sorting domain-containing protein n=1 Tax=uncultured Dokdonia sp. TaxID=575653 RepID=UPI002605944B|nr:T9SS type A sorting domain-containing protein [uncultured Dokdonia sp.]